MITLSAQINDSNKRRPSQFDEKRNKIITLK